MKKFLIIVFVFSFLSLFFIKNSIYASAPIGNYLVLSGGYVKTPSNLAYSPESITFETWIKPDSVSGRQIILSIGEKDNHKLHYELGINGGSVALAFRYGINSFTSITSGNLISGTWSHVAIVISPINTRFFINGKEIFNAAISSTPFISFGTDIVLGDTFEQSSEVSGPFKGLIDEVRISSSSRDISGLWNSGMYNFPLAADASTVLLWHLDESRGTTVAYDSSGHNLNGDLVGGDSLIHFFGVLPSPTPMPTQAPFTLAPIRWTRPTLPTLSFPNPLHPTPTPTNSPNPPSNSPSPTTYDRLSAGNRNGSRVVLPPANNGDTYQHCILQSLSQPCLQINPVN